MLCAFTVVVLPTAPCCFFAVWAERLEFPCPLGLCGFLPMAPASLAADHVVGPMLEFGVEFWVLVFLDAAECNKSRILRDSHDWFLRSVYSTEPGSWSGCHVV